MSNATLTRHPAQPAAVGGLDLARRFARSARVTDSWVSSNDHLDAWLAEQHRANRFSVAPIPFSGLRGWRFRPGTGNLTHDSGRFFSIEGLHVRTDFEGGGDWSQPIINQPEIGILGLLVKEFDGVPHFLMQAKMEPGNVNTIQLSPTVQATRSNYTGVHGGRPIDYLEFFTDRSRAAVLVDVLQSEQGSWFLRKRNRNMVVETTGDVPEHPDFRWLTLGQIHRLLRRDNVINMDARTVLSCIPRLPDGDGDGIGDDPDHYRAALRASLSPSVWALHTDAHILHWLTDLKSRHELVQRQDGLDTVKGWHRDDHQIAHESGRYFRVIATEVHAGNREVPAWTQPLVQPVERGVNAFLTRPIGGVTHLLVHARAEAGSRDVVELAPTVQLQPGNYAGLPPERVPRYREEALRPDPARLRYDTVQSEEGGRFYHAENRSMIIDVGEGFPLETPPEFCWMTPRQVSALLRHSYYVSIQARSLFAGLLSLA
ncbi:NDP-hexose 2,3-dehydratase family protein [Streptosporangium pseudovulgare]|uniref:NDP-hexose 2,3-dehydratase n=1 Tax=Streptosporangium pseudovulgare TaxID=35765 RepID=A0ABQ2RC83_9ACTN|nr:NDP-hexose 2,3-dehydratase family protein [Streptosporangium pseudovulgare]GGQ19730.1 NDP-hexose 2,3-dehydratase [Streptosporangium pseudovulgare]